MLHAGELQRRVAQHFGCSVKTINQLLNRFNQTGSTSGRPRSGRPRVTTARDDRRIRLLHSRNRVVTAVETTKTLFGRRVSAQTVHNRLNAYQLKAWCPYTGPILSRRHRTSRRKWTRIHRCCALRQWKHVMFTDESRFCLQHGDGRRRVWRRRGSVSQTAASQNGITLAAEV